MTPNGSSAKRSKTTPGWSGISDGRKRDADFFAGQQTRMSLAEFATAPGNRDATITVLNPERTSPVYRLFKKLFSDGAITVRKTTTESQGVPSDAVLVEKGDGDADFAVSSMESIQDEVLLVNSDTYVTGARELEAVNTPDVIKHLDELQFSVTGYPDNPREKLLLIEISRHIEAMAKQAGEGYLQAGFQYLSRLDNERGTRRVYERLGREPITAHVYGTPDSSPSVPGVTTHGVDESEIEQSWFVVYQSDEHPHEAAALVAVETRPNTWEGCWTYDPARVEDIREYIDSIYSAR